MKKLISEQAVKDAYKNGQRELPAPSKTVIFTPQALTTAKELGMQLVKSGASSPLPKSGGKITITEALVRSVVEKVLEQLPPEKRQMDVVKQVVVEVLSEYAR